MKNKNHSGMHTFLVLWKTFKALEVHDKASIASLGLGGISDFAILEILFHKGPLPVNTIGKKVQLTSGSITTAIDRAEKKGLVKRSHDPDDRRVVTVSLTAKGERTIKPALTQHATTLEKIAGGLNKTERLQLIELLKKLGRYAEALPSQTP